MITHTLTTTEVADQAGVDPATVRTWVRRGRLTPIRPGARPLRFRAEDVAHLLADHLDTLWERVLAYDDTMRHDE